MWLDRQEVYLAWAGLISAFIIALSFLGVSAWLISTGNQISGAILGTVDLVALTTVFVTRRPASVEGKESDKPKLERAADNSESGTEERTSISS